MKWDKEKYHHPWCNHFTKPREGCKMCEEFYKEYPIDDEKIDSVDDLLHKHFPNVIKR